MSRSGMFENRYQIEPTPIGQGGMGVVYKAFDKDLEREVAVKTIRGPVDAAAIEQFRKESRTLARLCHSNIVDIYDVGEFEDQDGRKPYFVMPFLSGSNLGDLLKSSGSRVDPERLVGIICQACKALHAAHIKNVVHCDLKPSNLFVLEDDSVKVIDFGVRHLVGADSVTRLQGTLQYMSPEQLEGKVTPQSDIFSLGIVCYEALTGRRPFVGRTEVEIIEAVRSYIPPSMSEVNPAIPHVLAQVVHRALAKQAYHRLSTAREFADLLQKALRNESLPQFDRGKIASRVARIRKALGEGDSRFAREMLTELGSEGHIDHEISVLSIQVEDAVRARTIHQQLESARLRLEEEDYPLAMQKVQSVLDLDRENIDALALKREIEEKRGVAGIDKWYQIARQHLDSKLFSKAREAVDEISRIDKNDARARELLTEIGRGEHEDAKLHLEIQRLYDSVLKAYGNGEISTALSKLERVMELGKRVSGQPQIDAQYESLYNEIRRERDELQTLYGKARLALENKEFKTAQQICHRVLDRRPADALFQALTISVDESERQTRSAGIADLHHRIESEADLEAKLQLVKRAVSDFPDEQTFAQSLKLVRQKRDLVNSICARARHYASRGQFAEARNQWDILRNIYPKYPGLDHELELLNREQHQTLEEQSQADSLNETQIKSFLAHFGVGAADATAVRGTAAPGMASEAAPAAPGTPRSEQYDSAFSKQSWRPQPVRDSVSPRAPIGTTDERDVARAAAAAANASFPIQNPSFAPVPKRESAPQPRSEALVNAREGAGLIATQLLVAGNAQSTDSQSAPAAVSDAKPPWPYQPKRQPAKIADPIEGDESLCRRRIANLEPAIRNFVPSRQQIAVAAGVVAAVVLIFLGAVWFRSKTSTTAARKIQNTAGGTSVNKSTAPRLTAQSASQLNTGAPGSPLASKTGAKQDAVAAQASAQEHSGPQHASAVAPVAFDSTPVPAVVRIDDGEVTCRTPCELKLQHGSHVASFAAENRQTIRRTLAVPGDQQISVAFPDQLEGVRVASDPQGLTLSVDGQVKGPTPMTVQLPVGDHHLQIDGNGLRGDQTIQVSATDGLQVFTVKAVQNTPVANP
jgi:serine/threonine protein kinase